MAKGGSGDPKYFTYKNVGRFFYVQCLGWAAQCLFKQDMLPDSIGIDAKTIEAQPVMCSCIGVAAASIAMGLIAACQMSDAGLRKFLQYGLIGNVFMVAVFAMNQETVTPQAFQFNIGLQVMNIGIALYTLYVANKPIKASGSKDDRIVKVMRWNYVQQGGYAAAFVFKGADVWGFFGGSMEDAGSQMLGQIMAGVMMMVASQTIAASQLSGSDARKYVQYSLFTNLVWNYVFCTGLGDMMLKANLQNCQAQMFLWLINNMLLMWAIYPAGCKTWYFRWCYLNCYLMCAMCTFNPALPWAVGQMTAFDTEATYFMGGFFAWMMGNAIVAAQCDDDMQKRFLQYWLLGYFYMLGSVAAGRLEIGMWFPQMVLECAYVLYLCYGDKLKGSGKGAMRSSSPKSRKRSSTPKNKRS